MSEQAKDIFPAAYGNEEEVSLMVQSPKITWAYSNIAQLLDGNLPPGITQSNTFLTNGARLYADKDHLEIATPECSTIDDLVLRIHASESLVMRVLGNHLLRNPDDYAFLMNRRVVDTKGNSWGMHDNFGFTGGERFEDGNRLHVLLGHLATRSFVTGAGLITPTAYYFAQKASISHLRVESYGYSPYMMRLATDTRGIKDRIEIRCGDIVLSDWATRMRVGAAALALAIQQTEAALDAPTLPHSTLEMLTMSNKLRVRHSGSIRLRRAGQAAVDYQKWLAETALSLPKYGYDLPPELQTVAEELNNYCEDFDKVTHGKAPLESLANRADWAAKLSAIHDKRRRDEAAGKQRTRFDSKEQAQDILYDRIRIQLAENDKLTMHYGWGYRLQREKNGYTPDPAALEDAVFNPPSTRAKARAELIRKGYTADDWGRVTVRNVTFHLTDPLSLIPNKEVA